VTVTLRPMTRDDLGAVMRLEQELFAPDTWTRAMYLEELGLRDTRYYLVAVDGTEIVGYAGLIAYPEEAHIATIGVTTARQGEGICGTLLDALLTEADRRCPVVLLEVRATDEATQGLYRRRGFVPIGVRPNYYPLSGEDALVMRRERSVRS
jgi:ribosomal-protein-alanine N-acetyltransferase